MLKSSKALIAHMVVIVMLAAAATAISCTRSNNAGSSQPATDTDIPITFSSVKMNDTSSFKRSNGEICQTLVEVSVTYPKFYRDEASTRKLQQLFIATVLEQNDSLKIDEAIRNFTLTVSDQNNLSDSEVPADEESYSQPLDKFIFTVNITVAYHQNGIITLCREETAKKNSVVSKTHRYFNIDLDNMVAIDLSVFREDAIEEVCKALKAKLMSQNNVKSSNELNELGYFNIDNLTVTTNFCFDDDGLTWSYLPQQLAADATLEPKITLDYSTLKQWAADNSVLKRF